jgi:hypothetical protein
MANSKKTNQQIADTAFDKNKDLNEVFVTSDGYPFATKNAANLHKNTSGKKGIKIFYFTRKEDEQKEIESPKVVKLDKLNKADLIKVAEAKGIRPDENATKAQIIEQIEALEKTKTTV